MTGHTFTISCVIPTHRRPELLKVALESVLNQSVAEPCEVIVVDDASDSESERVVRELREEMRGGGIRSIEYVARRGQPGASVSRNYGKSLSKGRYIAFLDDDDMWNDVFLRRLVDCIESSGSDMAIAWLNVLDLDGSIRPLYRMPTALSPSNAAAKNSGFTGSNFLIKTEVFDAIGGFDPELPVSNDKDFLLRFLLAGFRYCVAPEYLAIHRRHNGPQLTAGDERRASGVEAYMAKHRAVLDRQGRRYLKKRIHRIRMRTAKRRASRVAHTAKFLWSLSLADYRSKWRRRDGRYSDITD